MRLADHDSDWSAKTESVSSKYIFTGRCSVVFVLLTTCTCGNVKTACFSYESVARIGPLELPNLMFFRNTTPQSLALV